MQKGLPLAIGRFVELLAWTLALYILAEVSDRHMTVTSVAQNCWILFIFILEGLNKGVIALTSNEIGRGTQKKHIDKILIAGLKICLMFSVLLIIPLFIFPQALTSIFIIGNPEETAGLAPLLVQACHWVWIGFSFEMILWVLLGLVTAAGDTQFLMKMMIFASWTFGLLRIYVGVRLLHGGPVLTPQLWLIYSSLTALAFYMRYRTLDWSHMRRIEAET